MMQGPVVGLQLGHVVVCEHGCQNQDYRAEGVEPKDAVVGCKGWSLFEFLVANEGVKAI